MEIKLTLNGKPVTASIDADTLLIDFVRDHGCYSVKRGCETANATAGMGRAPITQVYAPSRSLSAQVSTGKSVEILRWDW